MAHEEDGRWSAWIEALPGCAVWGYTREEALTANQDAAEAYVEDMIEAGEALLSPGVVVVEVKERIVSAKTRATIADLYKVEGKAELVDGEIIHMPPSGDDPNFAGGQIFVSLHAYTRRTKRGRAFTDNAGFRVNLPHRESFSPDVAYHLGPRTHMRFRDGAPIFAVEVRSENDYGQAAERVMAQKRADYFATGTLVVWDVDLLSAEVIKVYRASDPNNPTVYRRGDIAEAEPAVPGWQMAVDDIFEEE